MGNLPDAPSNFPIDNVREVFPSENSAIKPDCDRQQFQDERNFCIAQTRQGVCGGVGGAAARRC
ncbi:MAG: hypothetical protein R6U13_04935 [Desulfatiglandaceae bacterium]